MIEIRRLFRPDALISLDTLSGVVFRREAEAHRFLIAGPAPFTGEVTACFRRADGITLVAAGSLTAAGEAAVTLTDDCYQVAGRLLITIYVTDGGVKTCVYAGLATVFDDTGRPADEIVDGGTMDTVEALLAETLDGIADARQLLTDLTGQLLTAELKSALLACFERLAWTTAEGQAAYSALASALNPPAALASITAVYTQSGPVHPEDSLLTLRSGLVVTGHYSDGSSSQVIGYTLSGTLTVGPSVITVSYGGQTASFTVLVTDAALVYELPQEVVFTGLASEIIDTGVVAIPSDRDTTFLIDFTPDAPATNGTFLFYTGMTVSPYNCMTVKCYTAEPRVETHSSGSGFKLTDADYGERIRLAIRYTQGAEVVHCAYRAGSGQVISGTSGNTGIVSANTTLTIGGVNSSFAPYAGRISAFRVYSRRLTDDETTAFLTGEVA